MSFWSRLLGARERAGPAPAQTPPSQPQAALGTWTGTLVQTSSELEQVLRGGQTTAAGVAVSPEAALTVAAVHACVRIISGAVATLPLQLRRRIDDRTRVDASDDPLWHLLRRRPNRWQTPSQFRRMMQTHLLLRGNAYAMIVRSRGVVRELIPLQPDRVTCRQRDDLALEYVYTRRDGMRVRLGQSEMFHLVGMTLDGITGVSVIAHARETIGLSLAMEEHGASTFRNGARVSGVLRHPGRLGPEAVANLKAGLDEFRSGGEQEGRHLILEEGMDYARMAMTAEDAQWIESRKFTRADIAMFFGVPPHMIGDTEKSTSWGTGIEQQSIGFVAYTLEDHLTTWEETIARDLIPDGRPDLYARFNRAALVKGDIKARWEAYVKGLQWGVWSPNEIRTLEDENPREGGDVYYPPPNMTAPANEGLGPAADRRARDHRDAAAEPTTASATEITADELIDLVYSLPGQAAQAARFVANRNVLAGIRKLKDGQGNYLWQPSFTEGQPQNVLAYPVTEMAAMPGIAPGALPVAFGDFRRGYLIVDRTGVRVLRDPFTNKPYVHFYTTKRVGGGLLNPEMLRVLKMAAA